MTLGSSLSLVFVGFVTLMGIVMVMTFRERRAGRAIAATDTAGQAAADARVLIVIFGAIPGGMLLTAIVAWLVFL